MFIRNTLLPAVAVMIGLAQAGAGELTDIDATLSTMAGSLTTNVEENEKKKVAVVDFSDLQGGTHGELGKYVAEQLTIDLVMEKRSFAVLDRANLQKILAEHKLTSKGLIDPDNAKKLGMFAGVDALILGTIIPKSPTSMALNAKIITTDTVEIIGAARGEFKVDAMVEQLVSNPEPKANHGGVDKEPQDPPAITKTFGDLRVELQSLRILNGNQVQLTFALSNTNPRKSVWVALRTDNLGNLGSAAVSPDEIEWRPYPGAVSGIAWGPFDQYGYTPNSFSSSTEIHANDVITATMKFSSPNGRAAPEGKWRLQMELLQGKDYNGTVVRGASVNNCVVRMEISPAR